MKQIGAIIVLLVLAGAVISGCGDDDGRYRELLVETSRRQDEQNRRMAEVQNQANATVQAGIEANREERRAIATDREDVREQMNKLDNERRDIASERQWDSTTTSALIATATLLAALSPLLLAGYCMRKSCSAESHEEAVREIVIDQAAEALRLQKQDQCDRPVLASPKLKQLK